MEFKMDYFCLEKEQKQQKIDEDWYIETFNTNKGRRIW